MIAFRGEGCMGGEELSSDNYLFYSEAAFSGAFSGMPRARVLRYSGNNRSSHKHMIGNKLQKSAVIGAVLMVTLLASQSPAAGQRILRAGVSAVDVTPRHFPV